MPGLLRLLDKTPCGVFYERQATASMSNHRTDGRTGDYNKEPVWRLQCGNQKCAGSFHRNFYATLYLSWQADAPYAALRRAWVWKVVVYGDITDAEKDTFRYLAERNALNDGFEQSEVLFIKKPEELEVLL